MGGTSYYDYCPALQGYSNADCTSASTSTSTAKGSVVGASSRCHVSTLNKDSATASSSAADCYTVTCTSSGQSYTLTAKSGATGTCTTDGAAVTIAGYGGAVTCGSPAAVCGAGETWASLCPAGYGYDAGLATCTACPSGYSSAGGPDAVCVLGELLPSSSPAASPSPSPSNEPPAPLPVVLRLDALPAAAIVGGALTRNASDAILAAVEAAVRGSCSACGAVVLKRVYDAAGVDYYVPPGGARLLQSAPPSAAPSSLFVSATVAAVPSAVATVTTALKSTAFASSVAATLTARGFPGVTAATMSVGLSAGAEAPPPDVAVPTGATLGVLFAAALAVAAFLYRQRALLAKKTHPAASAPGTGSQV
jgi:hypothetical protein